jgi:hypothetical protein
MPRHHCETKAQLLATFSTLSRAHARHAILTVDEPAPMVSHSSVLFSSGRRITLEAYSGKAAVVNDRNEKLSCPLCSKASTYSGDD